MSAHSDTSLSQETEWDGLSIFASADKTVSFKGGYLSTNGAVNTLSFGVTSACDITVVAKDKSNTADRVLVINSVKTDSSGKESTTELGRVTLPMEQTDTTLSVKYEGSDSATIVIGSSGGGICIKSIAIKYPTSYAKGDVNNDGEINSDDASIVMRHISNLSPITDTLALDAADADGSGSVDMLDVLWILNYGKDEETKLTVDTSDGTEVTNYTQLQAAVKQNAKIYVMNDIEMEGQLALNKSGISLIGVPDENNVLPTINFQNMSGNDIFTSGSGDSDVGVRVTKDNITIKNLIVEKAHDNGIQVKGTGATNTLIENCIVRYNNDSGIQVTGGATNTTLKCVYSYRNCDVYTRGNNADGFAVKLSAGPETTEDVDTMKANGNFMIDCYSWDNGDDGWDSFDYPTAEELKELGLSGSSQSKPYKWTYWNEYENCMGWNNGDPSVMMGYYDYKQGLPLDEKLTFMEHFKYFYPENYEEFVEKYNSGTLCSADSLTDYYNALDSYFPTITTDKGKLAPSAIALSTWGGNPNCFKLGSKYTRDISWRYLTNCIAFDHLGSGVDKNNSGANISAENIISFNNNINYHLKGYTAKKWNNIYGWDVGDSDDLPTGGSTLSSDGSVDKEAAIRSASKRLISYAQSNKVVASNVFNKVF
jgi:hypothetical protein